MEYTPDLLGGTVVLVIVRKKRRIGRREYSAAFPWQEYMLDGSDPSIVCVSCGLE